MIIEMQLGERVNMKISIPRWPYSDQKELKAVEEVLLSDSWWRNNGTQVKLFEEEFARYHDCKGAVSVVNGTIAIEVALKALDIKAGDEVIVPAFTFYSTISAVLSVNAKPIIVDVLSDTFCINPEEINKAITKRTKAIIVVHMAGQVADMEAINKIATENNLFVIEDAAHAHGASRNGKKVGSFGTCSTFSFQNAKLMTAGEGGIVLSNDESFLHRVFLEANCGREENDSAYQHVLVGTNARLSEVQGAILRVQLSRLEGQIKLRESNYNYLCNLLDKIPGIRLQQIDNSIDVNPHYMIMFYYEKNYFNGKSRDEFLEYLIECGIPSNRSFESLHRLPVFKRINKDMWGMVGKLGKDMEQHCYKAEEISDKVICINHKVLLGDTILMDRIADIVNGFARLVV